MRASVLTLLVAAFAVNTIAAPTEPTKAPEPTTVPTPTGTTPVPTAFPEDCLFTCSRPALAAVLNCINILTGLKVDVPISALDGLKKRTGTPPVEGAANYCCKTSLSTLSALTCIDIASGTSLNIPISLLEG
ncbi:hypothetical protein HYFRA_00013416 [Hymenoscyphus fraxineus]|uniref:Hydrophobin n=1 Tax=Hymenoscyphus fraxineus TaxID=746836 RepID=A0A9N9Q0B7_9HELO|nr:hypothetical protein HYFRA_00013416 [Hymenoscyphus fraxineus]